MTHEFDTAMTLTPSEADGGFDGHLDRSWGIGPAVNGGVLMGVAATALSRVLGSGEMPHADPYAFSAHFLSAGEHGPLTVATEVVRRGRSISTGEAILRQVGRDGSPVERMRALATYGDLAAAQDTHRTIAPPTMPAVEECLDAAGQRAGGPIETPPLMERVDLRLDPSTAGWAVGKPSGRGAMRAWIRFADGRDADPISLLFFLDAMPPVAFDLGIAGWAPTLEFTGHVRGRPAPGWLRIETTSRVLAGTLMEEDATIWDSTDRVVAQSRQLCSVRLPDGWRVPGR